MSVDSWTDVGFDHENDAASMSTGIIVDTHEECDVISLSSNFDSSIIIDTSQTPQATLRRAGSGITGDNKADVIPRIISKTSNSYNNPFVEHLDEKYTHNARSTTDSKRSIKHSLIKRDPVCAASMDFPRQKDEYIEVVKRPSSKDEAGSCVVSKTAVDDLLTELMDAGNSSATLGRDKRWKRVHDLFDRLENEGNAVRCPAPNSSSRRYTYKPRHYRFEGPPHEIIRYSVKPNGTYRRKSSNNHEMNRNCIPHAHAVHHRQNGRWKVWYELSSEPPLHIQRLEGITPLRGSLRSPPGSAPLRGGARNAFSPGVATICGAGSSQFHVSSAQQAVAENAVELFFSRTVAVSHASIAGKIHDTQLESLPRSNAPLSVAPGTSRRMKRHCHVAIEGTDAYCDRVEISARLPSAPKAWIVIGIFDGCQGNFDGCRDGHTETLISLTNCDAASRNGAVHCIALRFQAVSWHNRPMLRVGAYGHEIDEAMTPHPRKRSLSQPVSATILQHSRTASSTYCIVRRGTRTEATLCDADTPSRGVP